MYKSNGLIVTVKSSIHLVAALKAIIAPTFDKLIIITAWEELAFFWSSRNFSSTSCFFRKGKVRLFQRLEADPEHVTLHGTAIHCH